MATITVTDIVSGSSLSSSVVNSIYAEIENFLNGTTGSADVTITGNLTADKVIVNNLSIDGNTLSSTTGNAIITPVAGSAVVIDSHFSFDGTVLTALTDVNTTINAYAGKNITVESVTFDGGAIGAVTTLTMTGNLTVNTDKFTVAGASGNTVVGGTFTSTGDLDVNTDRFTVSATTGNTVIAGTLDVAGAVTFNDAGADVDFRVEGVGQANALFVQGSDGFVGIGTSIPSELLHLRKSAENDSVSQIICNSFYDGSSSIDESMALSFQYNYVDAVDVDAFRIQVNRVGDWLGNSSRTAKATFTVRNGSSEVDAVTILNTGNVGFGTATPQPLADATAVHVAGSSATVHGEVIASNSSNSDFILLFSGHTTSAASGIVRSSGNDFIIGEYTDLTGAGYNALMTIDTSGNVGIGTALPDGPLHVHKASAGTVTANANATLVLEKDGTNYLNFLGPNDSFQGILFGDVADNDIGAIFYDHSSNNMSFSTSASPALTIDSTGNVGFGTETPNSPIEIGLSTENLEIVDAGSTAATEQDWVQVEVGGVTGYLRVYATK